jgi:hypothetical protein
MTPPSPETLQTDAAEEIAPPRPMWELAECNCPEFCERDHELD